MDWIGLKARLLEKGTVRVAGEDARQFTSSSNAGPGAGGHGSVFFSNGHSRVRLSLDEESPVTLVLSGGGRTEICIDGQTIRGSLEPVAFHCPRQAYITVSSGCVFGCRYCEVPGIARGRKTLEEIERMVEQVYGSIDAIAITSGVLRSIQEEEDYVINVVQRLQKFDVPMGVSIFPGNTTAERLHRSGVTEVKFNVEAATGKIFRIMCPGLDQDRVWSALIESIPLFGRGHVFSNIIIGLGETDDEIEQCLRKLCRIGVIPVVRPLTPAGELKDWQRPSAERLIRIFGLHKRILQEAGLDRYHPLSMCAACGGCDLVPGKDDLHERF